MHIDLVLACLLICLGAMVAYVADEKVGFTPKLAQWLNRDSDSDRF